MTEETEKTANTVTESKTASQSPEKPANGETKPAEESPSNSDAEPAAEAESKPATEAESKPAEKSPAKPSSDSSTQPADARAKPDPKQKDRGLFAMAAETMKHVEMAEKDKSIEFRHNDRKSVMFMLTAFGLEVILMILFVVDPAFSPVCIGLALVADIFFGMAILWYVLLRFGVLRSFEPRHTLLTWQLMIGSGALFAFYTMNIAFAFFTYYNSMSSAAPPL